MLFFHKKNIPLTDFFTNDFVDIHSHILPGIDDGAKDIAASIALIEKMSSYGIKNFITTPHILGGVYPNTPKIIKSKLQAVQDALVARNITDIKIAAAAEYMMDAQFSAIIKNEEALLTLKDRFVLVEMSYFNAPINLYDVLFQLQLKGYTPILAHPERYHFYHTDFKSYYKLKQAGCLFQLNLLSLTNHYGKGVEKISKMLLKENMYDFIGTDTHHQSHLDMLLKIGTKSNFKKIKHLIENNKIFL
jgi:tyrosine-protein phosphatase YwqE